MLAGGLLMAGTDTTRNQLAASIGTLCDHPNQWELLARHPELVPAAVEELMRFQPIIFATMRVAKEDVEIGGHPVAAGTMVMVNTASANRDAAVYDDPDRLASPARARRRCSPSAGGSTTASAPIWRESNWPRHFR